MEFEYKQSKIFLNLAYGYFFLTFTLFISFMIVRKFILFPEYFNLLKIIFGCLSILLFTLLTSLFLGTALIRNQYYKNNLKYFVELDETNEILTIHFKENSFSKSIHFNEVKNVELYYSWNTNPFSSDLGYSKIILFNEEFVFVTQNNINHYHINNVLRTKITLSKNRFVNPLK